MTLKETGGETPSHYGSLRESKTLSACSTIKEEIIITEKGHMTDSEAASAIMAADTEEASKRSWRFYGTFGCLALLNFVCAIDATILSVSLPVRHQPCAFSHPDSVVLTYQTDNRGCSQCHRYPGFLVWYIFSPLLHRLPANMGFPLAHLRPQIRYLGCVTSVYRRHDSGLCCKYGYSVTYRQVCARYRRWGSGCLDLCHRCRLGYLERTW